MAVVKTVAIMYVERVKSRQKNKVYEQVLLRESYREPGTPRSRVMHRTLLNLTKYPPHEIRAIELGLKYKHNLEAIERLEQVPVKLEQGRSVGAVWTVYTIARRLGIESALGKESGGTVGVVAGAGEGDRSGFEAVSSTLSYDASSVRCVGDGVRI
jgi:hypothetical protein